MTIPVNSASLWKARFIEEMNRNVERAEEINKSAEVKTRKLTEEEIQKIFGDNPEYGKKINI